LSWFSAERPSQRASDETHFFKKSLGRIFGAATPPGALVFKKVVFQKMAIGYCTSSPTMGIVSAL
jgi:hypothetical protein